MELQSYWWELPKEKLHGQIFNIVRFLDTNQGYRQQQNLKHMRLYGNLNVLGLAANTYSQSSAVNNLYDRVSLNVVQSMCDTVTQKIAKNRVKPKFLTEGGDYTMKKKARLLEKFTAGQFYETDFYTKAQRAFLDACVFGTGALKIYKDQHKIQVDRVFIDEIMCDDADAVYGTPRCIYQRKYLQREVLVRAFPKFEAQIMNAPKAEQTTPQHKSLANNVLVIESWHLPSGEDAGDGRHVICIENVTLIDEPWEKDYFPFVFIRWNPRLLGFYGQGLAEQMTGIQIEINKILRTIQLSFHLCGIPSWMVESGSKIVKSHINNEIGRIQSYTGVKPELYTPNPVAPQLFEHLERLYQKAYEIAGISMLAAQSKKPGGLDSGRALREFNDIESERFIIVGQAWEQFHLDASKQMIELGKEIHAEKSEDGGGYVVKARSDKFIEKISWGDINLERDEYEMKVFPSSILPSTPAGKLQTVQELLQAGFIDKQAGLKLLDTPDLESYTSLANAALDDIEATIEKMLDKGEYNSPEPYQNLQYGIQQMQMAYLKAKNDGVDEDHLELLRRWMTEADALTSPPPAPTMPGGTPLAKPMPTPTSDLLPNAPAAAAPAMPPVAG